MAAWCLWYFRCPPRQGVRLLRDQVDEVGDGVAAGVGQLHRENPETIGRLLRQLLGS
jgi:hypothetical protein